MVPQLPLPAERERGLDATEDLASPGVLRWRLTAPGDRAIWILKAGTGDTPEPRSTRRGRPAPTSLATGSANAVRRSVHRSIGPPTRTSSQRGAGRTIIAGYPWFTDWGRDTFIALRGLCLATGRLRDARDILVEWAGAVSEGMLPNRFPDAGDTPEFNAVDASLWYVVAVDELLGASRNDRGC